MNYNILYQMENKTIQEQQISKMQYLMTYGLNENKESNNLSKGTIEYSEKCADGNTYGIIKECQKFYIKVAPPKNSELIAEDFDYIGGYMRKKDNEFMSYQNAYKHLGMKTKTINEACEQRNAVMAEVEKKKSILSESEWKNKETEDMRALMEAMSPCAADFNRICENVQNIKEGKAVCMPENGKPNKQTPEAPKYSKTIKKESAVYSNPGKYEAEHKNGAKKTVKDTYVNAVGNVNSKLTSDEAPKGHNSIFVEKPYSKIGTPMPNVSKSKFIKESEEVQSWKTVDEENDDLQEPNYGTKIGSSAPYDEDLGDALEMHPANLGISNCSCGKCNKEEAVFEIELEESLVSDKETFDQGVPSIGKTHKNNYRGASRKKGDKAPFTSRVKNKGLATIGEGKVNFGKHPRWQKSPIKADYKDKKGANGEDDVFTKEARSQKPYGSKIGSSYPYETVVESVTKRVMKKLGF